MVNYVVETRGLTKVYSNGVEALKGVNIRIRVGEIHTLLGRNGAGKTTFIRIIATQLIPTSGEAYVYGYDVVKDADRVRSKVAVVPQEGKTYNFTTPWHEVYLAARIWGYGRVEARKRVEEVLKRLELWEHRNKLCIQLSGGLRQRTLLARALVTDAELLILDEPTIGVDPLGRRRIWDFIREIRDLGKTIILTTHYMDEAEEISDRVTIIDSGRIVAEGTIEELLSIVRNGIKIHVFGDDVGERLGNWSPRNVDGRWIINVSNEEELIDAVRDALRYGYRVTIKPPDLEDVFISLVGEMYEE